MGQGVAFQTMFEQSEAFGHGDQFPLDLKTLMKAEESGSNSPEGQEWKRHGQTHREDEFSTDVEVSDQFPAIAEQEEAQGENSAERQQGIDERKRIAGRMPDLLPADSDTDERDIEPAGRTGDIQEEVAPQGVPDGDPA